MLEDIIGALRDELAVSPIFLSLGFVGGHAKTQSGCRRSRSYKYPRRPRKGITDFADEIGAIYGEKAAEAGHAKPSAKSTVLLDTP